MQMTTALTLGAEEIFLFPLNLYSLAIYPEPTYFILLFGNLKNWYPPILNVIEDAANVGCEKNNLLRMQLIYVQLSHVLVVQFHFLFASNFEHLIKLKRVIKIINYLILPLTIP
jgi:hypothetical protein